MNIKKLLGGLAAVSLLGCGNADVTAENNAVGRQQLIYVKNQPVPFFDWSLERHLMIQLYVARNSAVVTYTYVQNQFNGKIKSWCPSIGYPIPADTQLTNPLQIIYAHSQYGVIEQPEANGLYTSKNTRGTFVMCTDKNGMVVPRYHEQDADAFLTPMKEVDGMLVELEGYESAFTIDPRRPQTTQTQQATQ